MQKIRCLSFVLRTGVAEECAMAMPSAKMVAQNPAVNVKPLSSLGHACVLPSAGGLDWFPAETNRELPHTAVSKTKADGRALHALDKGGPSSRRAPC